MSLSAPHPGYFSFLQRPEDFGLGIRTHIANFVQEQGAAIGLFKLSNTLFDS